MSADQIAVLLVLLMAPAWTATALIVGFTTPWWRTALGRSLMASYAGLALLIDISLIYDWLGDDYVLRDVVRFSVFGLILVGGWMTLISLVRVKVRARRNRRTS